MSQRKRKGRPRKPAGEAKDLYFRIRVSKSERDLLVSMGQTRAREILLQAARGDSGDQPKPAPQ